MSSYYNRDGQQVFRINAPNLEFAKADGSVGKMDLGASIPFVASTPLPRLIAGFGDSFTANCHNATGGSTCENYGYLFWAAALSGRPHAPASENFGVGGENTVQFLARIAAVIAGQSKIVLFPSVTNDRTSGFTLADTKRNVLKIIEKLNGAGKIVIVGTGTPRYGAQALTTQQAADALAYRNWVLTDLRDVTPVVNIYDDFLITDSHDGLHPNPQGAQKVGAKFADVLRFFNMGKVPLPTEALDLWSAASPYGSLNANPLVLGSDATPAGSSNPNPGGVMATGYKVAGSNITGIATDWYKESADYGEAQVVYVSGTASSANGYLAFSPTAALSNLTAGDVISGMCRFDISGVGTGILGVGMELVVVNSGTTTYYRSGDKYVDPQTMSTSAVGTHETPRYTILGTETSVTVRVRIDFAQSVLQASKIKISQFAVRKV